MAKKKKPVGKPFTGEPFKKRKKELPPTGAFAKQFAKEFREKDTKKEIIKSLKRRGFKRAETVIDVFYKEEVSIKYLENFDLLYKGNIFYQIRCRTTDEVSKRIGLDWISIKGYFTYKEAIKELEEMFTKYDMWYEDIEQFDVFILLI